ncbi:MAG: hypothetical protein KJO45_03110, partial [Sulfurovum sp.]|nr:hypothetical protein [Sulfurovum sp.]
MLQQQVASLISKKSGISFIVFKDDFTIIDFDSNVFSISDAQENIKIGADLRECFWEFIGNEENILRIKDSDIQSFKIPMIYKNADYYDIDIECLEENIFIAYIIRKSEFSSQYLKAIQILNKNTLISALEDKKSEQEDNYYDLINQNVLRFHVDLDGIILEVNSICIYFFDKDESEIIGKHFSLFFQTRESQLTQQSKIFNAKSARGDTV